MSTTAHNDSTRITERSDLGRVPYRHLDDDRWISPVLLAARSISATMLLDACAARLRLSAGDMLGHVHSGSIGWIIHFVWSVHNIIQLPYMNYCLHVKLPRAENHHTNIARADA